MEAVPLTQPSAVLAPGQVVDGRFRIEAHLAAGGMGDVYRAEHVYMKRPVALKLLRPEWAAHPEMTARFQREAQVISQLDHPHIVRIFDFGRTGDGLLFLAMELVDGPSLESHLQRAGRLPVGQALGFLGQICAALAEAHGHGIIHRDLKPENVVMGSGEGESCLKILDFGIARLADSLAAEGSQVTQLGMVLGTPEYLSPEQALAQPLDPRTDLYSLSVIAFRMLAGRLPFVSENARELLSLHVGSKPPALAELRPELARHPLLCDLIERGLAKEREARPASARDYGSALAAAAAAASGVTASSPGETAPRPGVTAGLQPARIPSRVRFQNLTVVFTDIEGFTARTSRQTREQNRRILELHERLLPPIFRGYRGRIIKTIGDAFLVVFASPTNALLSAMALQDRLAEHNATAPEAEQLRVRVAVNLGEVTLARRDVFGEAVNVAARVEGIAQVGEIYFTEAVYLAMSRSEIPHESIGTHDLRGVDLPVKIYRVTRSPGPLPFGGTALEPLRARLRWGERSAQIRASTARTVEGALEALAAAAEWIVDGVLVGPLVRRLQALAVLLAALAALTAGGMGLWSLARRRSPTRLEAAASADDGAPPADEAPPSDRRGRKRRRNDIETFLNGLFR
ncbi:MAG: protein kinase domain-containing protein [Myxococcales bacterium]